MDSPQPSESEHPSSISSEFEIDMQAESAESPAAPVMLPLAKLWRRALAAIIDYTLLSAVSFGLIVVIAPVAMSIGPWGRLVGLAFALAYFGLGASRLTRGQTLGKKLLSTAVVGADLAPLSVPRALVRALIVNTIFVLNGWAILSALRLPEILLSAGLFVQGLLLFYGLAALAYLMLFNRAIRQGPHDLLVRSYVVNVPCCQADALVPPLPRKHRVVLGVLAGLLLIPLVVGIALFGMRSSLTTGFLTPLGEVSDLYSTLSRDPRFFSAQVTTRTTVQVAGNPRRSEPVRELIIAVWAKEPCQEESSFARCIEMSKEIAAPAFEQVGGIRSLTGMRIRIMRRADFTWATLYTDFRADYTIEDWETILNE